MVDRYNRGTFKRSLGNCSCSCGNTEGKECRELKMKLRRIDFSIIDTVLYLDAYPNCQKALSYYHKLKAEREAIVEALSKSCNTPMTAFCNTNETEWNWINSPWPWELADN